MSNYNHKLVHPGLTIETIEASFSSIIPTTLNFPFKLDPFQLASIYDIETNDSVLVSAPTSSGKTVVAEAAIHQTLHHQQRIIYTSPIKALTNQKYRQLSSEFGVKNVGLITGDVAIHTSAQCLVMTTEVLRGMLYQRNPLLRDLRYVIFDEVHYMSNSERGVVWEEAIILLTKTVKLILLSATIPNAEQVAGWVATIKQHKVHVISSHHRAVPLNHYLYSTAHRSTHLVVNSAGKFNKLQFNRATEHDDSSTHKRSMKRSDEISQIIEIISRKHYNPAIVFSFSKQQCDHLAWMMSHQNFVSDDERSKIDSFFNKAMRNLSSDDQDLPHVRRILPLLKNGIGMHHAGLLPIIKELVEILFAEGLLKVLFATETFAMGVNAPVQTVIFTNVYKYDGVKHRPLTASEYTQMAGRAGRRGYDDKGTIIMMVDRFLDPGDAKEMIKGEPQHLVSSIKFKNSGMLLNVTRVKDLSAEKMLNMSFHAYQSGKSVDALSHQLAHADLSDNEDVLELADTPLAQLSVKKDALETLGYLSSGQLLQKGMVAKEISSGDGVLLTEMIFGGDFDSLMPQQIAILLAYFVDAESVRQQPQLSIETHKVFNKVKRAGKYMDYYMGDTSYKNPISHNFRLLFMEIVHEWCNGRSFRYISEMANVFEGSIIRAFKHLQQLLRELSDAAKWTGDPTLQSKLHQAAQLINRPDSILTCSSIYLTL